MKKYIRISALILFLPLLFSFYTSAQSFTDSYGYDSFGNAVPVPEGYVSYKSIGNELGLINPTDLYFKDGFLYILDGGNSRVAVLNSNYKFVREIKVRGADGKQLTFNKPEGIFVSPAGEIAVADTANGRVLIFDGDGNLLKNLTRPDSEIFPKELSYNPSKVVIDDLGKVYVLSSGFYYGAVVYNANGEHTGFFGANRMKVTPDVLLEAFWRRFMTRSQLNYSVGFIPTAFSSFDIDDENFIYTCSAEGSGALKKLNFLSENIMEAEQGPDRWDKSVYGDRYSSKSSGATIFTDISVSDDGFIFALDSSKGRVFQYDQDSNLLNIFGAFGEQSGTVRKAAAIETVGDNLLLLDSDKGLIYIFRPTDYGKTLNKATLLYHEGLFEDAIEEWRSVLSYNSVSEQAWRGIGRTYLQQGNYKEAMRCAKLGQDRLGYSKAFGFYRSDFVRSNIYFIVIGIIVFIAAVHIIRRLIASRRCGKKSFINIKDIFLHPHLLYERIYSGVTYSGIIISVVIVALLFLGQIMQYISTGFIFNTNDIKGFNGIFLLAQSVGMVLLWTVSDSIVSSLRFGHGNFVKVWTGTSVAIVPYVISIFVNIVLSRVLVYEESIIMSVVSIAAIIFSALLLFESVKTINAYSFREAISSMLFNIITAVLLLLVIVVMFMLLRQLYIFAETVANEIFYRF